MSSQTIEESALTGGRSRKLNAPRKSIGDEIGERAFAEWLPTRTPRETDGNADPIAAALWPPIEQGRPRIPRGGYLVKRGRGRIAVRAAKR